MDQSTPTFRLVAITDYCASHPNSQASSCNLNNTSGDILALVIVGLIVALAIFDVLWKLRFGSRGPIARVLFVCIALITRLTTPRRVRR